MTDYALVMTHRHSGREWVMNGDDYDGLVMVDGGDKPSKQSLDDAWPTVRDEIRAKEAASKNARLSALKKLATLGLTDDEIAALVG